MSLRIFRWAAVLLATIGLAILYAMSIMREVPRVQIGDISNTMNFAYINLEAEVVQSARVYSSGDIVTSLGFTLDDGTGRIAVRAYGKRARELVESDKLPRAGDRITMDGSLNVSAEDIKLYLQVPESLEIIDRKKVTNANIDDISRKQVGEMVRVSGRIAEVDEPGNDRQPWSIQLKDASGSIEVVIWPDVYNHLSNSDKLAEGAEVELRGEVSEYRGNLRVELKQAADLVFKAGRSESDDAQDESGPTSLNEGENPVAVTTAELDPSRDGDLVAVSGKLGKAVSIKGGVFYMLYDDSGEIKILLWDSQVMGGAREQIGAGAKVRVAGVLNVYHGKVEIVPRSEHDIEVLSGPTE